MVMLLANLVTPGPTDRNAMGTNYFNQSVFDVKYGDKNHASFAYNNEFDNAGLIGEPPTQDLVNYQVPFTSSFNKDTIGTAMYM